MSRSDQELSDELHEAGLAFSAMGVLLDAPGMRDLSGTLLEAARRLDHRYERSVAADGGQDAQREAYRG